jgi:signal transduction histidine kinase
MADRRTSVNRALVSVTFAMNTTKTILEPLRERTDLGLGEERAKTDLAFERAAGAGEAILDAQLESRRSESDELLSAQRVASDASLSDFRKSSRLQSTAVDAERARTDQDKREERSQADALSEKERGQSDAALREERDERDAIDAGLAKERAATDTRLQGERDGTDDVIDQGSVRLLFEQDAHAQARVKVARRDDFLALVGHELRNPLTSITLNAEALLEAAGPGVDADERRRLISSDIQQACAHMTRLVSDLLDVASAETGHLRIAAVRGDLTKVLQAAVAAQAPLFASAGLSVLVAAPDGPLWGNFDSVRLLQVFANLFGNAVKFTGRGGRIDISVAATTTELRVCVTDSGVGIAPDALLHVFDRFWQAEASDRRGLGLGLYLCKAIIDAHGGSIWATSELGGGSKFCFTLPRVA